MVRRGIRRLEGIAPLVDPRIDLQSIVSPCRRHELPHPHGARTAYRRVGQPAFDEREVDEVFRQSPGPQALADHALVTAQPGQPDLKTIACVELEEFQVLEHAAIAGKIGHVDVECGRRRFGAEQLFGLLTHVFTTQRDVRARRRNRIRTARVQTVQRRLIGSRVALDVGQCRAQLRHGDRVGWGQRGCDRSSGWNMTGRGARGAQRRNAHHRDRKCNASFHRVAK